MIPEQEIKYSDDLQVETMPSKTYKINNDTKRIEGTIDNIDAINQTIDLILATNRYEELIYPEWFGNELYTLIGQDRYYIESEAERMIKEALMVDDRITGIRDFLILDGLEKDEIIIKFRAITIFGEIEKQKNIRW